jgi:16S rRNA (guanine966-N2)-methyltransferase
VGVGIYDLRFDVVMRVIAGTYGGRRLVAVPGAGTRPTADRVREALFSRLQSRYAIAGISVLDLFAGTGALGIEAISRGAGGLVSVERSRQAARVLLENLRSLGLEGHAELVVRDFEDALAELERSGRMFGGVFVDPPYGQGFAVRTLEMMASSGLLSRGAWVSVETAEEEALPSVVGRLVRVREDTYGDTKLTLYELTETIEH